MKCRRWSVSAPVAVMGATTSASLVLIQGRDVVFVFSSLLFCRLGALYLSVVMALSGTGQPGSHAGGGGDFSLFCIFF